MDIDVLEPDYSGWKFLVYDIEECTPKIKLKIFNQESVEIVDSAGTHHFKDIKMEYIVDYKSRYAGRKMGFLVNLDGKKLTNQRVESFISESFDTEEPGFFLKCKTIPFQPFVSNCRYNKHAELIETFNNIHDAYQYLSENKVKVSPTDGDFLMLHINNRTVHETEREYSDCGVKQSYKGAHIEYGHGIEEIGNLRGSLLLKFEFNYDVVTTIEKVVDDELKRLKVRVSECSLKFDIFHGSSITVSLEGNIEGILVSLEWCDFGCHFSTVKTAEHQMSFSFTQYNSQTTFRLHVERENNIVEFPLTTKCISVDVKEGMFFTDIYSGNDHSSPAMDFGEGFFAKFIHFITNIFGNWWSYASLIVFFIMLCFSFVIFCRCSTPGGDKLPFTSKRK